MRRNHATVLGIAELVGVAVQGSRRGHGLIGFPPVNHIQQIGFDPAHGTIRIPIEAREPFGDVQESRP
jgi:uncharacterized protein YdhG (YjbR/CyaY superfamily)